MGIIVEYHRLLFILLANIVEYVNSWAWEPYNNISTEWINLVVKLEVFPPVGLWNNGELSLFAVEYINEQISSNFVSDYF